VGLPKFGLVRWGLKDRDADDGTTSFGIQVRPSAATFVRTHELPDSMAMNILR